MSAPRRGDRVWVDVSVFRGWGTVTETAPRNSLNVRVMLDHWPEGWTAERVGGAGLWFDADEYEPKVEGGSTLPGTGTDR
jgi:hypothetical protein